MLWILLVACAPEPPEACPAMCEAAAALYGGCLEDWGVSWSDAGYADRDAFVGSCETWAWELTLLEADAGLEGHVAETCEAREALFSAPDASCDDYTQTDWDTLPWDEDL